MKLSVFPKTSLIARAVAASLGLAVVASLVLDDGLIGRAQAAESTAKGQAGSSDRGGRSTGSSTSGQGGPSADSDAKGPKYGGGGSKPAPGTQGGKPVWAQEGIPSDLELGRLNVARAPAQVFDRQLAEALKTLDPKFYNAVVAIADNTSLSSEQKLAALQELVKQTFTDDTLLRIDSPLQNLALYKDMMLDGKIIAPTATLDAASSTTRLVLLTAVFIGGASDKTVPISTATVEAINKIMSLTLPSSVSAADIAAWAEAVRLAIVEAHG